MENYNEEEQNQKPVGRVLSGNLLPASIVVAALIIGGAWVYGSKNGPGKFNFPASVKVPTETEKLEDKVLPDNGIALPVKWGDLGIKITGSGVLDLPGLESLYATRGEKLSDDVRRMLTENFSGQIKMTPENSGALLNVFWALGLGNKNVILDNGAMADPKYGGAGNFASTGGWALAKGGAMDHYSRHPFIMLDAKQQKLVEEVARNIYRPCCNNATHFPDCNHGMAMLGVLELLASQGVGEKEMYKIALQINSYWFPDTYLTIANYLQKKGVAWQNADPKEILGYNYSSYSGYQEIKNMVTEPVQKSGGGCGV